MTEETTYAEWLRLNLEQRKAFESFLSERPDIDGRQEGLRYLVCEALIGMGLLSPPRA